MSDALKGIWDRPWTSESLELLWRDGDTASCGPVAPSMILWLRAGSPIDAWMQDVARRAAARSPARAASVQLELSL